MKPTQPTANLEMPAIERHLALQRAGLRAGAKLPKKGRL